MNVFVSMLRGVNVGGNNKIRMDALRVLYESLGFRDVQSHIQSGNVVFRCKERDAAAIAGRIGDGIEKTFGARVAVILRTAVELRRVMERNPFPAHAAAHPSRVLVTFLSSAPGPEAQAGIRTITCGQGEEVQLDGVELYCYYPIGIGASKLPALIDRTLKTPGTGRNWNTVTKLLDMADKLERL